MCQRYLCLYAWYFVTIYSIYKDYIAIMCILLCGQCYICNFYIFFDI